MSHGVVLSSSEQECFVHHHGDGEEKIAERIDANLLNVNIQDITELPKQTFETKVNNLSQKTQGTLIIKEYPTASAHSGHFKSLLNELALKKSFRPDIIFIDYLNICAPLGIGEAAMLIHIRLLSLLQKNLEDWHEPNVPIVSATQPLVLVMVGLMSKH